MPNLTSKDDWVQWTKRPVRPSGNMKVEDWKYYNEKGELLKTEKYFRDKLQETIDN